MTQKTSENMQGFPASSEPAGVLREERFRWLAAEILPHEAAVRQWLYRHRLVNATPDDIIQECYARLCAWSPDQVVNGRALFFHCARNLMVEHARKARVEYLDRDLDPGEIDIADTSPPPDRILAAREELNRLKGKMLGLPTLCRDVFVMRKIYNLSHEQIALRLGISRRSVRREVARGLDLLDIKNDGQDTI
ncbi:RNA polymerase sigma factor [Gluconacetobacter asukensis]